MSRIRTTDKTASEALKTLPDPFGLKSAAKVDGARQLKDAPYDKNKVEHVKHLVYSLHKSIEGLHEAVSEITLIKSHEISPDGKLGGRGYVMTIKDFKDGLSDAMNVTSNLMDTLDDELTNPNWGLAPEEIQEILSGKEPTDAPADAPVDAEDPVLDQESLPPADESLVPPEEPVAPDALPPVEDPMAAEAPEVKPDEATIDDLLGHNEKMSAEGDLETVTPVLPTPPVLGDKPGLPYEKLPKVPYEKLAMMSGRPDLDAVANMLRAPILFNMFDSPTGN